MKQGEFSNLLSTATATSLACGLFDVAWAGLRSPGRVDSWAFLLVPAVVATFVYLLSFLLTSLIVQALLSRISPTPRTGSARLAIAVLHLLGALAISSGVFDSLATAGMADRFVMLFLTCVSVLGVVSLLFLLAPEGSSRFRRVGSAAQLAPLFVLPVFVLAAVHGLDGLAGSAWYYELGLILLCAAFSGALAWRLWPNASSGGWMASGALLTSLFLLAVLATTRDRSFGAPKPEVMAPSGAPRLVIFLTIDSLRADHLGTFGALNDPTPNLDSVGADSLVFHQARSQAPWTLPSLATILTGVSPIVHQTGLSRKVLPLQTKTVAELLRARGYSTAAFGHNVYLRRGGLLRGFDALRVFPRRSVSGALGQRLLTSLAPSLLPIRASTTDLVDLSIDWLDRNSHPHRFLWLHLFDPHVPYSPPARFLPPGPGAAAFTRVAEVRSGFFNPTSEERERIRELYAAEVRYVDEQVGRLLARLRQRDDYDDALIVVSSDHGEEFWEHGGFEHGQSLYDELLKVPLLLKLPSGSLDRTGEVSRPVSTGQIAATILEACGVMPPREYPIAPSLGASTEEYGSHLVATGVRFSQEAMATIRGEAKLIEYAASRSVELFNLTADPRETDDLSSRSSPDDLQRHLELAKSLRDSDLAISRRLDPEESGRVDMHGLDELRSLGYIK